MGSPGPGRRPAARPRRYTPGMDPAALEQQFAEILRENEERIFNMVYWHLGDYEDARDLTQDIFLAVYRNLPKFRGEARVSTWIYRIALNRIRRHLRRQRFRKLLVPLEALWDRGNPGPTQDPPTLPPAYQALHHHLRQLPEEFRTVVILFYFENLSIREVAETLGVAEGTVKSRLNRARRMLRERLKGVIA